MREISEYNLLGCYLLKFYEKTGIDFVKYENGRIVTENLLKRLNKDRISYKIIPVHPKSQILTNMINSGVFKPYNDGNKRLFSQVKNYELSNGVQIVFDSNKTLLFKLSNDLKKKEGIKFKLLKHVYENDFSLEFKQAIKDEVSSFSTKTH